MRIYVYWKNDWFGNNAGNCKRRIASSHNDRINPSESYEGIKGKVVFNAIANNKHLNTQCGVHGEFASTVLDSVTRCDVHTLLGTGAAYGTIDLDIKMIRPFPKDENLIAEGNVNQNLWKKIMDLIDGPPRMIFPELFNL